MFLKQDANGSNKWTTLTPLRVDYPRWNPVSIGKSIWISKWDGMIEVDCESNTIKQTVSYPKGFEPQNQSACGSDKYAIVIVDGKNGKLIEFDPKNKKYKAPVAIPKLGEHTSSIMINGYAHMIHGGKQLDESICYFVD